MKRGIVLIQAILIITLTASIPAVELNLIDAIQGVNPGDNLGRACEGLGDINGDGYPDFLMSEWGPDLLHLYLGGSHPFDSAPVITWDNYSTLYHQPVNIGDIDCDGTNDFAAVFYYSDTLRLFLGMESLDTSDYVVLFADSTPGQDSWDYKLSASGDNNNDGTPEFWVNRRRGGDYDDTIWGYSGCQTLDTIPDFMIIRPPNPTSNYILGAPPCANCDLNGDSIPEIIWGEYYGNIGGLGRVCIVWGGQNLSTTADLVFYAPGMGAIDDQGFGSDIACMGDISGDGIDDLWVRQGGRNYAYFGGQPFDTIVDVALDYSYVANHENFDFVENVGDINNDGWNDLMLVYATNLYSQVAFLYCYPQMDTIVDVIFTEGAFQAATGEWVEQVGTSFSYLGDMDRDGISDVLIYGRDGRDAFDNGWLFIVSGWEDPVAADNEFQQTLPSTIQLEQNYPNPFNSGTTIEFTVSQLGHTQISIFNLLGQLVTVLVDEEISAGTHQLMWDGKDFSGAVVPSGIYFYEIETKGHNIARKMILLK
jgi:hypothetical protein